MAMTGTIDTLEFARKLRDGGVDERTADNIAQEIGHFVADNIAPSNAVERVHKTLEGMDKKPDAAVQTNHRIEAGQRFMWWAISVIVAALFGVLWQLFAVSHELAALSARIDSLTTVINRLAQ